MSGQSQDPSGHAGSCLPVYKWIWQSQQLGGAEHLDKSLTRKSLSIAAGCEGSTGSNMLYRFSHERESSGSYVIMKYHFLPTPEEIFCYGWDCIIMEVLPFSKQGCLCACFQRGTQGFNIYDWSFASHELIHATWQIAYVFLESNWF